MTGTRGVGVLMDEKWVEKVLEVRRVNARVIVLKLLFDKNVLTVVSTFSPQIGLRKEKDEFWDTIGPVVSGISEREVVVIGGDLNGHVGALAEGYEGVHGGSGFRVRNTEGVRILEFGEALDMVVCNTMFKKRLSRLITFESGGIKSQIDYFLVSR